MSKKKMEKPKNTHGGRREGSGKFSFFPVKANATTFAPSKKADSKFRHKAKALGVSLGDFIEAMFWQHGREFTSDDVEAAVSAYKASRG
jgi:hypothetical protein